MSGSASPFVSPDDASRVYRVTATRVVLRSYTAAHANGGHDAGLRAHRPTTIICGQRSRRAS
jgi:hypothetical protein